MSHYPNDFTRMVGIQYPIICGAMYPCSNPELIAAASEAGGIGIVQPMSMIYVHGHDLREGLRLIKQQTQKPIGFNAIVEKSVKAYEDRMRKWVDIALEEGVKLFITALGNPRWIVARAKPAGAVVFHDITERKWAEKALESGVDGLICVNDRAGGHAGTHPPEKLFADLKDLGVPLVCAGGVGDGSTFRQMLDIGYQGVQMGTRFIAATECKVHDDYKQAIVTAKEEDIGLTDKLSGVPCSIIKTPYVEKMGLRAGWLARRLLRNRHTKHWMRTLYSLQSIWRLKKSSLKGSAYKNFWQAGKSVAGIDRVQSVAEIVQEMVATPENPHAH